MTKRKVDLATFNETVLPSLRKTYPKVEDLQAHIDKTFNVFEEVDGKEQPVTISLIKNQAAEQKPDQASEPIDIPALVQKTVEATMKAQPKPAPVQNVEVKPAFLPEGLKLYKSVKNFSGTEEERKLKAYQWGCFILGGVMGMSKYADKLKNMGIVIEKAQGETVPTAGGVLVPHELDNYIVDLREQYGVFRRNARIAPMTRDTMEFPRRTGGLTSSFASEAAALTESSKAWDSVSLSAKKLTALAKMSIELMEDAIINVGDDLAGEIAYAFSLKEDQCGFTGDGTSTYGGINGVNPKIKALVGATTTSAGGVVVAAGDAIAEVTLADLHNVIATLPQYADGPNTKWYCSRYFWAAGLERLARAAGGTTSMEVRGAGAKSCLGYPVEISQVFPSTNATSQILCLFGDLTKAATFGDRRQTTISVSDQVYWANDQVGIKGTERFDIVVHDIGTATTAGPIVALQSLNS